MVLNWRLSVAAVLLTVPAVSFAFDLSAEHRLVSHLFANYSTTIRPVLHVEKPVRIHLIYYLHSLGEVNEKAETVTLNGYLHLRWNDEFLTWQPDQFENVASIFVPSNTIWTPDLLVENAVGGQFFKVEHFRPRVHSNGDIRWDVGGRITLMCEFQARLYPFDEHECTMKLGTWAGTDDYLKIDTDQFDIETNYQEHGIWHIVEARACNITLQEAGENFTEVHYSFRLRRKSLSSVLNVVLPVIVLSILNGAVFCVPQQSGEKVSFSLTLLLSFTILQFSLDASVPSNSASSPLLDVYIITFIVCSCVTAVVAVFSIRLYYRQDPVASWAKSFLRLDETVSVCCGLGSTSQRQSEEARTKRGFDLPSWEEEENMFSWFNVANAFDRMWCVVFCFFFLTCTATILSLMTSA